MWNNQIKLEGYICNNNTYLVQTRAHDLSPSSHPCPQVRGYAIDSGEPSFCVDSLTVFTSGANFLLDDSSLFAHIAVGALLTIFTGLSDHQLQVQCKCLSPNLQIMLVWQDARQLSPCQLPHSFFACLLHTTKDTRSLSTLLMLDQSSETDGDAINDHLPTPVHPVSLVDVTEKLFA